MRLRSFRETDIAEIDRIWREHHATDFSVPDRSSVIVEVVAVEDEKVIAYGQVKLFAEAMMILDLSQTTRTKVEALKLLMGEAFRGCDQAGLKQLYIFAKDPDFATIIARHFGFDVVEDRGELLLREEV